MVIEVDCQACSHALSDNGSDCGTGYAHGGKSEITEDQDGIEDDVNDGTRALCDHRKEGSSGRNKESLKHELGENTERACRADREVGNTVVDDRFDVGHRSVEGLDQEESHKQEYQVADERQEDTVPGREICPFVVLASESFRKYRVHADADTHTESHKQQLDGESHRNGGKRILVDS